MDQKDTYFVAVKIFLEDGNKLLILKDGFGQWDLPGGRIRKDEFEVALSDVVKRKMKEEVGEEAKYELGEPIVFMRHERVEQVPGSPTVRIFAIGYQAMYAGGKIHLPSHHQEIKWVDINDFKPEEYFTGGWLKGLQEYLKLRRGE